MATHLAVTVTGLGVLSPTNNIDIFLQKPQALPRGPRTVGFVLTLPFWVSHWATDLCVTGSWSLGTDL